MEQFKSKLNDIVTARLEKSIKSIEKLSVLYHVTFEMVKDESFSGLVKTLLANGNLNPSDNLKVLNKLENIINNDLINSTFAIKRGYYDTCVLLSVIEDNFIPLLKKTIKEWADVSFDEGFNKFKTREGLEKRFIKELPLFSPPTESPKEIINKYIDSWIKDTCKSIDSLRFFSYRMFIANN